MLARLTIHNLALIRNLERSFSNGLTIVSGETGAGKSILIQAMEALLGEPVHSETVRTGSTVARVEGFFSVSTDLMEMERWKNIGLVHDRETELSLTREIHRQGRDRFLVNDQVVRKADFQWLGSQLLDINSQHSHQYLLRPRNHLELFDSALNIKDLSNRLRHFWDTWQKNVSEWKRMKSEIEAMERNHHLMEYQMEEIDAAGLRVGEKEDLITERERLRYAEEIRGYLSEVYGLLEQGPGMIADNLARVASILQRAARRDNRMENMVEQAEALSLTARDLGGEIQRMLEQVTVSPERLHAVSDRLFVLQQLEGKYKNSIEGILEYRQEIENAHTGYTSEISALEERERLCGTAREEYWKIDRELSACRKSEAPGLCRSVEKALADLGMLHARFDAAWDADWQPDMSESACSVPERCSPQGTDRLEFLLSANPGVPLKPLSHIASGGELSRVMLALKQYLAGDTRTRTMVFDEVDSGIGGDVANAVGEKLRALAAHHQIICVTHLPQIAVRGHQHFIVEKQTDGAETSITIGKLDPSQKVIEIARMLGGRHTDESVRRHAEAMLKSAAR